MKTRYISLILLILCSVVFARLNENSKELKKRYGAPVLKGFEKGDFYFLDGFLIKTVKEKDRAVYISYQMKAAGKSSMLRGKKKSEARKFAALPNVPLDGLDIEALL